MLLVSRLLKIQRIEVLFSYRCMRGSRFNYTYILESNKPYLRLLINVTNNDIMIYLNILIGLIASFEKSCILLSDRLILYIYRNDINSLIDARIMITGDDQIVQFMNITTVYTDLFEVCNAIVDLASGYIT